MNKITLQIHCKDQSGIIAAVTNFIALNNGNIVYIDQHVDREQDIFFMRLESEFEDKKFCLDDFKDNFKSTLAQAFNMKWRIYSSEDKINMALFVSKYETKNDVGFKAPEILELLVENYDKSIPAHRIAIKQYLD